MRVGGAASVFVYGDPRSSYVRNARMALVEKGVAYTLVPWAPHSDTLAGDTVTLADLLLAPIVFYLAMLPESQAALANVPNVRRAHDWIARRESFRATMPPR